MLCTQADRSVFQNLFKRLIVRYSKRKDTFSHIYEDDVWNFNKKNATYWSGCGSHEKAIINPYISAVRSFIAKTFPQPPNAVDLGCGDFNVGRQIRNTTDRYIACDIFPGVIDFNRRKFAGADVDFRVLDMVADQPPEGDIVFVRQVLQHFRNDQISRFLFKLRYYKWAIITEHIPSKDPFVPNLDIGLGDVRLAIYSGVDLTQAPFNLKHYNATIICEIDEQWGRIRTTAYQLRKA